MRSDGGYTLVGYIAKNLKTKNIMDSYTKYPAQSTSRAPGQSFLFQGPMDQLPASSVVEGVSCHAGESLDVNCAWVRSAGGCDDHCQHKIRASWGYADRSIRPNCIKGTTGAGTVVPHCHGNKSLKDGHPSVLGWQIDVHASGHCWAGRGNCCSGAGGSSVCGRDPDGTRASQMWIK